VAPTVPANRKPQFGFFLLFWMNEMAGHQ